MGAATSLLTKQDPLKGAIMGAVVGGVSGGVMQGLSLAAGPSAGVGGAGVGAAPSVGSAGLEAAAAPATEGMVDLTTGTIHGASQGVASGAVAGSPTGPAVILPVAANTTKQAVDATNRGLLSGWMEKNPYMANITAQTLGGAAKGMLESRTSEKEIAALMERDKLNRDALKIKGLTEIDMKVALPSIAGFTEKPRWQMPQGAGFFAQGNNDAKAKTA
jgi:hypothetical protein